MTIGRLRTILFVILALGGIWLWLVYPALEEYARGGPLRQVLRGAEQGDVAMMRAAFTADGAVKLNAPSPMLQALLQGDRVPIDRALKLAERTITAHTGQVHLRFEGFINNPSILRDRVESDIALTGRTPRSDDPKRWVPFRATAHVVLTRVGFLQWKIREISSPDGDFDEVIGSGE